MLDPELRAKLDALPNRPGVYLMKDRQAKVIYVGKAVNLRDRVRSYFNKSASDARTFVQLLDRVLADVETVVVSNEKEALLLENEYIKKLRPRFNVQLRDDKNFLCLRLDVSHDFPRLEMVRRPRSDGARYFGPYASASSIREMLRVVNRFFQLRTCTDQMLRARRRPCLLYQMGRCPAPCVFPISSEAYRSNVNSVILFLEGRSQLLLDGLDVRMKNASKALEFEDAARLRDQIVAIERSLERQMVVSTELVDQDVFGLYREADRVTLYTLYVRGGRMTGGRAHHGESEFPDDELIASFVNQYYADENVLPHEVILPSPGGDDPACETQGLAELLTEKKGEQVRVSVARRGDKAELVKLAAKNAARAFSERIQTTQEVEGVLRRLKERLCLTRLPRKMECFDISHHQGSGVVASQVASVDTVADHSRYRRYLLRSVKRNDDFAAMHEVIGRRLRRGLKDGDLPDLIVIDGGKGQLAAAHAAIKDEGASGVDLVALAKSRELDGGPDEGGRSPERVFLIDRKDPVVLGRTSAELFALTRLRDEAHRFAITFQRKVARRQGLASLLDQIPGIGQTRRTAVLQAFGSLKAVREASLEELAQVEGMGPKVAQRLFAFLHTPVAEAEADVFHAVSLEEAEAPEPLE